MVRWRNSKEYREWREEVIRECDNTCTVCGSHDNLHAHHMHHASYYKELRYVVKNGVALCMDCHTQFHNNFKSNSKIKCDYNDYKNFKALVKHYSS